MHKNKEFLMKRHDKICYKTYIYRDKRPQITFYGDLNQKRLRTTDLMCKKIINYYLESVKFLTWVPFFRSDIEIGNITGEDVLSVLPFNNTIDRLVMNGKGIRAVLENFAAGLCPDESCFPGTFLQVFWSL